MTIDTSSEFKHWLNASANRFPEGYIDARLLKEQRKSDGLTQIESRFTHRFTSLRSWANIFLSITGLGFIGGKQASNVRTNEHDLIIKNLPTAFDGYRILHISDPHFNANTKWMESFLQAVNSVEYDLCVLTGDYRYRSFGPNAIAIDGLTQLKDSLHSDVFAILGNHDSIETVPHMESMGISVLLNESVELRRGDESVLLAGVDDPSYYRMHNLALALGSEHDKSSACSIVLAHSPNMINDAIKHQANAYLCGHTHGGQICLPGGFPLMTNTSMPRWCVAGGWNASGLAGYTSVGVGVSMVQARLFCPPEITVHTLRVA